MASAQQKYDATLSRIDAVLDATASRLEAADQHAALEADFARAQRARDAAEARREIQATYSDAYRSFGSECPTSVDDELPSAYRRRLFERLRRKLPSGHRLADVRADDLGSQPVVFDNFEAMLLQAAAAEGAAPSEENLPSDGSMVVRTRSDDAGGKITEFFGRRSYIADMGQPGRRVLRIVNPKTGDVLLGRAFDRR